MEHDRLTLAWVAGFLDGEGHFALAKVPPDKRHVYKRGHGHRAMIRAAQVDATPLLLIQNLFGGRVYNVKNRTQPTHAPSHVWDIHGKSACLVAQLLVPYLVVKRAHATLLVEFGNTIRHDTGRAGYSDEVFLRRDQLADQIRVLNIRGIARGPQWLDGGKVPLAME